MRYQKGQFWEEILMNKAAKENYIQVTEAP